MYILRIPAYTLVFGLTTLFSCNAKIHTKDEIGLAMKKYDRLIQKMDADSIALLYTEDGDLGNMAHGRDSIRNFLASFKGYRVLSQSSTSTSIKITADTAIQKGFYNQVTISPKNDTLRIKGEYQATWVWIAGDGWHIKHMETKSL